MVIKFIFKHGIRLALTIALCVAAWEGTKWAVPLAITLLFCHVELHTLYWNLLLMKKQKFERRFGTIE